MQVFLNVAQYQWTMVSEVSNEHSTYILEVLNNVTTVNFLWNMRPLWVKYEGLHTKFSPEGNSWRSFLAFCKFTLPPFYESIQTLKTQVF
jgi:hypothetical protein